MRSPSSPSSPIWRQACQGNSPVLSQSRDLRGELLAREGAQRPDQLLLLGSQREIHGLLDSYDALKTGLRFSAKARSPSAASARAHVGGHQRQLELEPAHEIGVEGAVDQRLDGARGRAAARGERAGHLLHDGAERAGGSDAIDQPPVEGLRRAEPAAQQHHLLGPARTDEPRQALAAAAARDQAEVRVLVAEPRGLVGHDQVGHERQLEPARQRQSLNAGDHRHRQRFDAVEDAVPEPHEARPLLGIRGQLAHGLEVGAGAEGAAGGGERDGAHGGVALHRGAHRVEILEQTTG